MDETNPKDTTASPAAGSNPAPASSGVAPGIATAPPAVVSMRFVPPVTPVPLPAPLIQTPVQPAPIPPVQLAQPQATQVPGGETGTAPDVKVKPVPQTASEPGKYPLREDIARIIGKIKLPERVTVKMRGEQVKPPAPPAVPTVQTKETEGAGSAPKPGVEPAAAPHQNENAQKERPSSVASVHTLKDDLQNVVRDKKMSLVRAVALESEKKKGQEHLAGSRFAAGAHSRKVIGVALVAAILLALGSVAFVGVKSVLKQGAGSAQPAAAPSLMFAEKTLPFSQETRTGMDLRRTLIAGARSTPNMSLGAIVHIVPTSSQTDANGTAAEQAMGIGEFLTAIEAQATPELIRSLRGDFFLGLHQTVEKRSPVLVIPVTSYERAFAGMLAWEPTVNANLSPIFTFIPPLTTDEKGLFVERQFEDSLINNYDVRVLRDDAGAIQMMYSFPTRTMLIIAESPYSFTEVLSRLRASRQL